MYHPFGDMAVDGLGPLTGADLALRARDAFAEHMKTYTATEVLHEVFMSKPYDPDFDAQVRAMRALIGEYRETTRARWRATYSAWADVVGVEVPDDFFDDRPNPGPADGILPD
jgi:hypothetical protein